MSLDPKHAANELSVALNDAAAIFAIAAVITAPFGVVGAVAFGVASGAAWLAGNEYSDLANDPPRHDYQLVERFRPGDIALPLPAGEDEPVWAEFSRVQIEMGQAITALVTSFERLAGARLDLRKEGADPDSLARHITTQRHAIRHNAAAAKQRIPQLLGLRSAVNAVWRKHVDVVRTRFAAMSVEERRRGAKAVWEKIAPILSGPLRDDLRLRNLQRVIERAAQTPVQIREDVLDEQWRDVMLNMDRRLSLLAGQERLTPLRQELESSALAKT